MPDAGVVPIEGAGANAEPVKVTETSMLMPLRDRFVSRYVAIVTGVVLLIITLVAGWNWLHGNPVSEAQDRWWMLVVGLFLGLLSSTSAQTPPKKDET